MTGPLAPFFLPMFIYVLPKDNWIQTSEWDDEHVNYQLSYGVPTIKTYYRVDYFANY